MARRALLLLGPNLKLLGLGKKSFEEGTAILQARAVALDVTLRVCQSNAEGELLDTLFEQREWADAVLLDLGILSPRAEAVAEALKALGTFALEIDPTGKRTRSALKGTVKKTWGGDGFSAYLKALESLVPRSVVENARRIDDKRAKTMGPAARPRDVQMTEPFVERTESQPTLPLVARGKTIGRKTTSPDLPKVVAARGMVSRGDSSMVSGALSRAAVREKIAERLRGALSAQQLSTWARARWNEIQKNAPTETGQRDLIEETLQLLITGGLPGTFITDDRLIELMARLDS